MSLDSQASSLPHGSELAHDTRCVPGIWVYTL